MPSAAFGAWGLGFVWGALAATIIVRRRPLLDAAWTVGSTAAVVAAAGLITGDPWTAAHTTAAAFAGWATRRILESFVERRHGRRV